jgi:hypothetical protein
VNLFTGEESDELFGGEVSPTVKHLIDQARQVPRQEAATLLWTAALSSPGNLPVYYLLYKLHAGLGELDHALRAAEQGLRHAAAASGLPDDWRQVRPGDADFGRLGPARFWLFTLKAMAFIHLRSGQRATAQQLVQQIERLDPTDQVGASVVGTLLKGLAAGSGH